MRISQIYPTAGGVAALLNAKRCSEQGHYFKPLTIESVNTRDIKGRQKIVAAFKEIPDVLVLNKTNALILAEAFGDDTDAWVGKQITLVPTKRTFQGTLVDAIEVVPQNQQQKPKVSRKA
jgi:hypothetical protein